MFHIGVNFFFKKNLFSKVILNFFLNFKLQQKIKQFVFFFIIVQNLRLNKNFFSEMTLTADSHFYNIPVNINYSSVQIPTNVYDLSHPVAEAISWSEGLDETFRQNYRFVMILMF